MRREHRHTGPLNTPKDAKGSKPLASFSVFGGQSPPLRIAFLPFYVDYYEGICADFPREKAANAKRCADVLSQHGEVVWDGELIRNVDAAAAVGKKLTQEKDAPPCALLKLLLDKAHTRKPRWRRIDVRRGGNANRQT